MSHYQKAKESVNWPSTKGKISEVRLWGKRRVDGIHQDADKLAVKYGYKVQDQSYTSSSVAFYTLMYPKTFEFAQQHQLESDVTVYYNPEHPFESVLVPGLRLDKPYSDLILSAIGITIGISISVSAWLGFIG